ncbi:hypothetical protein PIB30_099542, partial [Stylosanthes scabra]|nr:hypothetical protein [Stylosanthes scabra]
MVTATMTRGGKMGRTRRAGPPNPPKKRLSNIFFLVSKIRLEPKTSYNEKGIMPYELQLIGN